MSGNWRKLSFALAFYFSLFFVKRHIEMSSTARDASANDP